MKKGKELGKVIMFTEKTQLHVGDYFRAYKSKYYTLVKEIAENQRNYEDCYGEYIITMVKVNIYNKEEKLLAEDSIVPIEELIAGALAKYIPNTDYDPTYLGMADPYKYPVEYKIWKDMTTRCFDYTDKVFPYIGGLGTTVCDRWRCFEYFLADLRHMEGYQEVKDNLAYNHYVVDLYDIQKHIHPSNRIYAPGYVKLKPFKQSDICRYYNLSMSLNTYPKDLVTTTKYITGELDPKETLYKKQTGMIVKLDLTTTNYYYDQKVGYQPLVARTLHDSGYMHYNYHNNYNEFNKFLPIQFKSPTSKVTMCTIVRKD